MTCLSLLLQGDCCASQMVRENHDFLYARISRPLRVILLNDRAITVANVSKARLGIGYLPQDFCFASYLFGIT